jgi:ribosomal protein L7Ae-like RNA K-turn-binding protein
LQVPNASAHSRRNIALPTINVLDPIGSINNFNNFIVNLFGGLIQAGQNAISTVVESKKAIASLVASVVDSATKEVETLVNQAAVDIWKAVNNSAIGTAIRIEECKVKGIQTVAGDAFKTGKHFC